MDDSGTRNPDNEVGRKPKHGNDWFGFGGVMICDDDEPRFRQRYGDFMTRWEIEGLPLHSSEIRARSDKFHWLEGHPRQAEFYEELYGLMNAHELIGIACVIDRPGYNARYHKRYGRRKWHLCKTAFAVCVERAAKYARAKGCRLRVLVEKGDKTADAQVRAYYNDLKTGGAPFSDTMSSEYSPLNAAEFTETLYEFRTKQKSSPLIQLADLYLWPMCIGGYNATVRPYRRLIADGRLIDCHLATEEETRVLGIKYSCFESVVRKH